MPPPNSVDTSATTAIKIEPGSFGASAEGRELYQWESKYPKQALTIIRIEALALFAYFLISLVGLLLTWSGFFETVLNAILDIQSSITLKRYGYFTFSGLLAGSIYSIKWLYHSVGKGIWHVDRQLWRFLSPFMSLGVAFIVGALVHANLIRGGGMNISSPAAISIGFVAGYFSDSAIAKMYEIANVIFGTANSSSSKK
jgi:hypothetical protein